MSEVEEVRDVRRGVLRGEEGKVGGGATLFHQLGAESQWASSVGGI